MQSSNPDEPHDQSKNRGEGKPNEIAQINYNYEPNQLKPSIFLQLQPKIWKLNSKTWEAEIETLKCEIENPNMKIKYEIGMKSEMKLNLNEIKPNLLLIT